MSRSVVTTKIITMPKRIKKSLVAAIAQLTELIENYTYWSEEVAEFNNTIVEKFSHEDYNYIQTVAKEKVRG